VLELRNYVAVLARPGDCCGLTLCEQRCPNGSLRITDGDPIEDRPCVDPDLQSVDVPGLYLAGDLTGLPLIRNAISQGEVAIARVAASLASSGAAPAGMLDVVIVGAGPAGLSAALCAKAMGLHYEALEQGSVAESIRSFPRGKLVFDQPLEVPSVGTLWLRESTKEELLGKWLRIVRTHALSIREHHRVEHVAQTQGSFVIHARDGDGREVALATRRVVLAVGRRGTPRKLPLALPDAVLDHVHYSLADARSFSGARVVVVGLGDVAMESAMALARQPGTTVTVVYRGAGFRRGKARNIAEMRRLAAAGRIDLRLQADVVAVHPGQIELSGPGDLRSIAAYDALFVMIGSIPPWAFLEQIGIRRLAQSTLK
jgi:thioredoxin reductase